MLALRRSRQVPRIADRGRRRLRAPLGEGARRAGWGCRMLPLADGGEGTLEALGGASRTALVTGPLGSLAHRRPELAGWTAAVRFLRRHSPRGSRRRAEPRETIPSRRRRAGTGKS